MSRVQSETAPETTTSTEAPGENQNIDAKAGDDEIARIHFAN